MKLKSVGYRFLCYAVVPLLLRHLREYTLKELVTAWKVLRPWSGGDRRGGIEQRLCRVHCLLRVTPAMEAKITDHVCDASGNF